MRTTLVAVGAFLVASLIPALVFAAFTPLVDGSDVVARLGMVVVFYYFSALATGLLGFPAFLLLWRLDLIRWWSTLITGFAIGALVAIFLRSPSLVELRDILVMGFTGIASALGFWLVWRYGRQTTAKK